MSGLEEEIGYWLRQGRLHILAPRLPGSSPTRVMIVSQEVHALLSGPWADQNLASKSGRLRADLEMFILGQVISVARQSRRAKSAYMNRLHPAREEVWEIRSRAPQPSVRIFGRFAEMDVFVALTWSDRPSLGGMGSREWRDAIEGCKAEWRKLFPSYPPFTRDGLHGYVSEPVDYT